MKLSKDLDEQIEQIQYDCWSDEGRHTPETSSCQECHNQIKSLIEEKEREEVIKELSWAKILSAVSGMNGVSKEAPIVMLSTKL